MSSWLCPRSSPTNKILPHTAHRKGLVRSQRHTRTLGLKTGNKGKVHCLLQPGHSLLHLALPVTRLRKRPQDPLFVTLGETWVWGGIRRFFTGPFIKDVINQAERVCKQMIYWKTIFFNFIYKSDDEWARRELKNIKKKLMTSFMNGPCSFPLNGNFINFIIVASASHLTRLNDA